MRRPALRSAAALLLLTPFLLGQVGPAASVDEGAEPANLLLNPAVRREIKLTADQAGRLAKVDADVRARYDDELRKARQAGNKERLQELFRAARDERFKGVRDLLAGGLLE